MKVGIIPTRINHDTAADGRAVMEAMRSGVAMRSFRIRELDNFCERK